MIRLDETGLAIKLLEKAADKYPEQAVIFITQGEALVAHYNLHGKSKYLKTALLCFSKALKIDPGNYLAKLLSAQIYLKAGSLLKAIEFLESIVENSPGDERATRLLDSARARHRKITDRAEAESADSSDPEEALVAEVAEQSEIAEIAEPAQIPAQNSKEEPDMGEEDEVIISTDLQNDGDVPLDGDTKTRWDIDEKVVLSTGLDGEEEEYMMELLASKLTIFSRLDGMLALFLIDGNGIPVKSLNKAGLDENVMPSMIFNLFKSSSNGLHRAGLGNFQSGRLVTSEWTMIVTNAFYATLAVVTDNDADMNKISARIQRYLSEVT